MRRIQIIKIITLYHITTNQNLSKILKTGLPKGIWLTTKAALPDWIDTFILDRIESTSERKGHVVKVRLPLTAIEKDYGIVGQRKILEYRLKHDIPPEKVKTAFYFRIAKGFFGPRAERENKAGETSKIQRLSRTKSTFATVDM